jgi:uncharacterized protein YkwD
MRTKALGVQLLHYVLLGGILLLLPVGPAVAQDRCLVAPQHQANIGLQPPSSGLEQELLQMTNQHRMLKGLPELVMDEKLTQIAREHSDGMAQQGFISHELPSGNLRSRMNKAGYLIEIARENVASAPSIGVAQSALIGSPDHRSNILADDVTRIGIGIARCPDPASHQLYITEIFAAPREAYQTETVQQMLETKVNELRLKGAGSMEPDPALEQIAARSLKSISMPYRKEELQNVLSASAEELGNDERMKLVKLQANVQMVHNPSKIDIRNDAPDGRAHSYGTAIRQVTDSQNQAAFLVLTLIGITR